MNKVILVAIGAIAFASATAYAQFDRGQQDGGPDMTQQMRDKMQKMHGKQGRQGTGHEHGSQTGGKQEGGAKKAAGGHADGPRGNQGPSSAAFHAVNQQMHEGMNITFTGNADVDFVQGMIPHHQGAVQMAKVVLAFGTDAELRALAEEIIKAQENEIAFMRAWLERQEPKRDEHKH